MKTLGLPTSLNGCDGVSKHLKATVSTPWGAAWGVELQTSIPLHTIPVSADSYELSLNWRLYVSRFCSSAESARSKVWNTAFVSCVCVCVRFVCLHTENITLCWFEFAAAVAFSLSVWISLQCKQDCRRCFSAFLRIGSRAPVTFRMNKTLCKNYCCLGRTVGMNSSGLRCNCSLCAVALCGYFWPIRRPAANIEHTVTF